MIGDIYLNLPPPLLKCELLSTGVINSRIYENKEQSYINNFNWTNGLNIIITTRKRQKRMHRKNRINKKWAKRYGFIVEEVQQVGKPFIFYDKIYMTETDFIKLKEIIDNE